MKKKFILSAIFGLLLINSPVFAGDMPEAPSLDDQSMAGTNLSSNNASNPFTASSADNVDGSQPLPDTAGSTADDSDSW